MRHAAAVVALLGLLATAALAEPSELFTAAKKGDEKAVAALLAAKPDVNAPNDQGWTPLIIAAYGGHVAVVKQLLDAHADPNLADSSGFTALMQSARFGHLDVVKLLVEHKAKLEARPTSSAYAGKTVLHLVIEDKQDAVTEFLVAKGSDVNAADPSGKTPLMLAVKSGKPEIVKLLLAAKAGAKAVDSDGNDAVAFAAMSGSAEIAELLLKAGAPVDGKNKDNQTPLFHAAHGGKADVVKLLLSRGAKARVREQKFGDTALFRAAQAGSLDVVKQLIDAGAPVDEANDAGETPLMAAAGNGHVPVLEVLIQRGANKDAQDNQHRTAAVRAAKNGHTRAAEVLEAHGATVTPGERAEAKVDARARWFRAETIKGCGMLDVKNVGLERCTLSFPTQQKSGRRFEITVRDMARLEPGVDVQKADHELVASTSPRTTSSEYIDVNASANYALTGRMHLVVVPVVTGTPDAFTDGHIQLFVYDEEHRRFLAQSTWVSPACGGGCTAQSVGLRKKGGKVDVEVRQTSGSGEHTMLLSWDEARHGFAKH